VNQGKGKIYPAIQRFQNKEKLMGHKGVSKRKPKKLRPVHGTEIGGSSTGHSPVQSLVNNKSVSVSRDGMKNPFAGSNKTQKKH
jgi:hypothetical protein